jgi:hypothetical protein
MSANPQDGSRPTVVLVHGAFAESASWNDVIRRLQDQGCTVIAAANPLRSVAGDDAHTSKHARGADVRDLRGSNTREVPMFDFLDVPTLARRPRVLYSRTSHKMNSRKFVYRMHRAPVPAIVTPLT